MAKDRKGHGIDCHKEEGRADADDIEAKDRSEHEADNDLNRAGNAFGNSEQRHLAKRRARLLQIGAHAVKRQRNREPGDVGRKHLDIFARHARALEHVGQARREGDEVHGKRNEQEKNLPAAIGDAIDEFATNDESSVNIAVVMGMAKTEYGRIYQMRA